MKLTVTKALVLSTELAIFCDDEVHNNKSCEEAQFYLNNASCLFHMASCNLWNAKEAMAKHDPPKGDMVPIPPEYQAEYKKILKRKRGKQ